MIIDDMRSDLAAAPALARGWWRARRDVRSAGTTVGGLDALDDHLLRDIGVRRTCVGPFRRHRSLWP